MSKYSADEKSENRNWLNRILSCIRFLTPQGKSFLAKNMIQSDYNLVPDALKSIKTTIETLKIKKKYRGRQTPNDRVEWIPIRALHPFVPSALDSFLRRTTLKYTVTARSLSWPQGA